MHRSKEPNAFRRSPTYVVQILNTSDFVKLLHTGIDTWSVCSSPREISNLYQIGPTPWVYVPRADNRSDCEVAVVNSPDLCTRFPIRPNEGSGRNDQDKWRLGGKRGAKANFLESVAKAIRFAADDRGLGSCYYDITCLRDFKLDLE